MIQMYHVNMSYGLDSPALVDVSLRIEKAEFVFLTGPSGAGKTSLLRLMYLAELCDSGQVLLFGQNVAKIKQSETYRFRRRIGVIFQDFKLLNRRTVFENVAVAVQVLGENKREVVKRTNRVIRLVGLEHKFNTSVLKLSGGEQQRVAIARAIVNDPPVVLADEPTGNLDPVLGREIYDLLTDIHARGATVVVATHDMGWVGRTQKRVMRLEKGRILSGGLR